MITTSSKYFFAVSAATLVAAVLYGYTTGGGSVGPLSLGYLGAVGDHLGYGLLVLASTLSLFLGLSVTAFRDAEPEVIAEMLPSKTVPSVAPAGPSYWPIIGAFAAGTTVVGLAVSNVLFVAGLIALGVVAIEWTVQAWSDRATGDPAINREVRNRIMYPLEVPLAGALAIAVVVGGVSRVLLAVSAANAVWVALGIAAVVFGVGAALGARPTMRKDIVAGLLAVFAVAVIASGIIGGIAGEREIVHHDEHSDDGGADHSDDPAADSHETESPEAPSEDGHALGTGADS